MATVVLSDGSPRTPSQKAHLSGSISITDTGDAVLLTLPGVSGMDLWTCD